MNNTVNKRVGMGRYVSTMYQRVKRRTKLFSKSIALGILINLSAVHAGPQGFATVDGMTTGGSGGETIYINNGADLYQVLKDKKIMTNH
ncbi:hypothetical protein [Pleionea litopenaei]|uniref:Uncharacterized protein n=1 Tax=Pleionea litopenaei TaxID=3070815 RepID=A0AA51X7V9_9GAMM|nr:hypothetical protein [Pleionea sp. HL-JVS1]WMS88286.1 hypothetical protein Q9312_05055 [Pleionea sp. HL-JVS1]